MPGGGRARAQGLGWEASTSGPGRCHTRPAAPLLLHASPSPPLARVTSPRTCVVGGAALSPPFPYPRPPRPCPATPVSASYLMGSMCLMQKSTMSVCGSTTSQLPCLVPCAPPRPPPSAPPPRSRCGSTYTAAAGRRRAAHPARPDLARGVHRGVEPHGVRLLRDAAAGQGGHTAVSRRHDGGRASCELCAAWRPVTTPRLLSAAPPGRLLCKPTPCPPSALPVLALSAIPTPLT